MAKDTGPQQDKVGLLSWRGALAKGTSVLRRVTAGVLALLCVALAFTQLGFIGFQFVDGSVSYLILMLVPVALAACLLGALPGAGIGLLSGAALYLHSVLMPLDYYEVTFVTPLTTIVAMCLCGFLLGVVFAAISRGNRPAWVRMVLVALSCLVVSALFSVGFSAGAFAALASAVSAEGLDATWVQAIQMAALTRDGVFQAASDGLSMAVFTCLGFYFAEKGMNLEEGIGLRDSFAAWLSSVAFSVFLVISAVAYCAITVGSLNTAADDMSEEAEYLLGQVKRTAEYNGKVVESLMEAGADMDVVMNTVSSGGMLGNLLDGYTEETDGLVVVSLNQSLIGIDTDRLSYAVTLQDCLGVDGAEASDASASEGELALIVYDGPSADNDLIDVRLPGRGDAFSELVSRQVGYLVAAEDDGYRVTIVRSARMVFSDRGDVMLWTSLSSALLLLAMFLLTRRLLDQLVARRIDDVNASLALITAGELDSRVEPAGEREFVSLAEGVNSTVDALQGWIAEAETRMDAELATAKAIQESALPRVFPPFPDILRFDIYASMNAAKKVGGDFYDFFLIGDESTPDAGRLGFVIADVSGKGVPAALFMMKAKTQLRDYMESGMELGEAVENANRQLCDGNDAGMFVTAWAGVLDYATGHIDFVNAGHNPPLLWQDGGWRWVEEKSGLPLGLFDGLPYTAHSLECGIGDQLLLYTDGVTEAMSVDEELYGEERLEALANANYPLHPRELVAAVRSDVARHAVGAEQSDDITVLALEVGVPPEITATLTVPADVDELPRVNEFIHTELDRRLCPLRAQNQLDIAVEELFVNVAHYAYEGTDEKVPRVARVSYTYSAEPPSVQIDIADDGVPYDPLAKPDAVTPDDIMDVPIGGLGILMAKNSVDEMRYERVDGSNVVTIVKKW